MAHKKAGGSTNNGRDSNAKRLGVKRYGGGARDLRLPSSCVSGALASGREPTSGWVGTTRCLRKWTAR